MARLLGCLLVAGMATVAVLFLVGSPDKAGTGGPVLGLMLAAYLVAYLYGRPHISAIAMGVGAAALWLDLIVVFPPVPGSIVLSLLFAAAGAAATLWMTREPVMAVYTAMSAALLMVTAAWVLVSYGPERFVPDVVGRASVSANPLLENRIEAPDPYVGLLAIGALLAGAVIVLTVYAKRGQVDATRPRASVDV
jgi:hypothetical protein